jgi:DNA-binding transcriptional LysR family regulator
MDLNRASAFIQVVEHGGFTKAAAALGLPPSSVSRSVAKLEHELGVTLLERTTRKIALTDAGRAYFDRARDAIIGLEQASAAALAVDATNEARGVVRIAMPHDFASVMGAAMAELSAAHPQLQLDLMFTAHAAAVVGDVADIGLAIGRMPDSPLVARKVGPAAAALFASPAYLAARGTPRRLAQLAIHDLVVMRGSGAPARWELDGPTGRETVELAPRLAGDHLAFVIDATLAGAGIALLPTRAVAAHVAAGTLVAVLPKYQASGALHVLIAPDRHVPRRVAVVRDFLIEMLGVRCTKHLG